ncbi:cell wall associated protein [Streptococcus infantarius subsp. infantarius]|nr:cell wall associated protein [Streptococcus infantarius subsp. infantarius]
MPDIGDKEENVNAEQDLALKDDQVSTEENQLEQETVVSEEINQSADFPETVTVDAADLVGEAKANQESFVRESKVSVTAQSNLPSQGFDVLVTNISDPKEITSVKVPVWTVKDDQDDIIWYDATRQGNGDYKVRVNIVDHKGETGTYNVHLYYQESDGHLQGVAAKQVTLPEKTAGAKTIPAQGSYVFQNTIEVKNEARMSAPTEFTFEKGYKLDY